MQTIEAIHWLRAVALLARHSWTRPGAWRAIASSRRRFGACLAASFYASAQRRPSQTALCDERGSLTFRELSDQILCTAAGLARRGVGPGTRVGLLCRNHRGFVIASAATSVLRGQLVYLNTGSASPEIAQVARRERIAWLIHDQDLSDAVREVDSSVARILAWTEAPAPGALTLDELGAGPEQLLQPPSREAPESVILTSGTTGAPRGAVRRDRGLLQSGFVRILERLPLQFDGVVMLSAPLFHAWGLGMLAISAAISSTLVLQRRFVARDALAAISRHRADLVVLTPPMVQRLVELPRELQRAHDTSSVRLAVSSGASLPPIAVERWAAAFGENLYSFYGSTELHVVAFATPGDLREAPATVGLPVPGVEVRIVDEDGRALPVGTTGRILVGSPANFAGYTDGTSGTTQLGLFLTGDLGHLDGAGRLYVDGRADDVIVSGGEKVLPAEVEDLLGRHPSVLEVAVIGVSDERFGQRLKAFVVPRSGTDPLEEELKQLVREQLATHKVPREIEFVSELPMTTTGKVLRRKLVAASARRSGAE